MNILFIYLKIVKVVIHILIRHLVKFVTRCEYIILHKLMERTYCISKINFHFVLRRLKHDRTAISFRTEIRASH